MQYFYVIKNIGHHACLRERGHLFGFRAYFEGNLLRFVRARANDANIVRSNNNNNNNNNK